MRIYLDEDTAANILVKLLTAAGHDVTHPVAAGLAGQADAAQLTFAIHDKRVLLTHNYDDFEDLHDLILAAAGRHRGLIVIRKENDSTRDLSFRGIASALRKIEQSAIPLENEYLVINNWR